MVKSLWQAEVGIFFALWLYLAWLGRDHFLTDPGVYWNTVVGQHVLAGAGIPRTEQFSCTFAGRPWYCLMWLADCVMAGLHAIGGLEALALATAVLIAGLYAWVSGRLMRDGWHWSVALLLAILAVLASRYHLLARPHLATIVCLGLTVARLLDFEAGRIGWPGLLWLLPLFVLWTNLHTAVLGGLGTLGLTAVGWSVAWLVGAHSPVRSGRDVVGLAALCLLGGLATLVNPYGWKLLATMLALLRSEVVHQYMIEHQPMNWQNPYHWIVPFLALLYLLALANLRSWRSFQVTWLLPFVWLALSIERFRHCALFAITTALVLVEVLPRTRVAAWLAERNSWLFRPRKEGESAARFGWRHALLPGLAVAGAMALLWAEVPAPLVGKGWAKEDPTFWPLAMRDRLQALAKEHPGAAVFNDMAYGGFLIYYTPGLRPFIDDRCEVYGDAFLADYFHSNDALLLAQERKLPPGKLPPLNCIDRWAKEYGIVIDLALVRKRSGFHYYLESMKDEWIKLDEMHEPFGAALYQRRTPSPVCPKREPTESR